MSENKSVTARSTGTAWQVTLDDGRHQWQSDTVALNGGGDQAADPESMVLGALAACTAITLRMYAARKQWPLQGVEVSVRYAKHDRSGTEIERKVHLLGDLDQEQHQAMMVIADKCPIHRMLTGPIEVTSVEN